MEEEGDVQRQTDDGTNRSSGGNQLSTVATWKVRTEGFEKKEEESRPVVLLYSIYTVYITLSRIVIRSTNKPCGTMDSSFPSFV